MANQNDKRPVDQPAFPSTHGDLACMGMTLRDYFAAKALQGAIAGSMADEAQMDKDAPMVLSKVAYKIADAMLVARED